MKNLRGLMTLTVISFCASCSQIELPSQKYFREQKRLTPILIHSIEAAQEIELIAIDPEHRTGVTRQVSDPLARWSILGRTNITNRRDIHDLAESLESAIRHSDGGYAMCFQPRHALRFTKGGKEVLVIVCFECLAAEIYGIEGMSSATLALNFSEEKAAWNRIFEKHGLTIADRVKSPPKSTPDQQSAIPLNN